MQFVFENPGAEYLAARNKREAELRLNRSILAVFAEISAQGLTLKSFLLGVINSQDRIIREQADDFASKGGLKKFIYRSNYRDGYKEIIRRAAIDITTDLVKSEFEKLRTLDEFRCPATSFSSKRINNFSFETLDQYISENGPIFYSIMRRIIDREDRGEDQGFDIVTMIVSIIIHKINQHANYFQTIMGVYLFSQGCPKRVVEAFSRASLSISYMSIHTALKSLTDHSLRRVAEVVRKHPW